MKVLVLGAGVIGVTTSYYLAKAGCEVTVLDRQPGPGLETSFSMPGKFLRAMRRHGQGRAFRSRRCAG